MHFDITCVIQYYHTLYGAFLIVIFHFTSIPFMKFLFCGMIIVHVMLQC